MTASGSVLWYLSRGTGLVSLVLLTLVVIGGVLVRSGQATPQLPRFVMWGLHRNVALIAVAFIAVHVTTVVLDAYVPINLVDTLVPFVSSYRPVWLGLGTVALDLLLAVVVTSLLRQRIGHRAWRAVHWAAYALWPSALVHGLGTGSDVGQMWFVAATAASVAAVACAVVWRMSDGFSARPGRRPPNSSTASVATASAPALAGTSAGAR